MAQLWGGRFTGSINELAWNFNASISFDKRFLEVDVAGSKAHATMLAAKGIITEQEKNQILDGLDSILRDVQAGNLEITTKYEDIHSFFKTFTPSFPIPYRKRRQTNLFRPSSFNSPPNFSLKSRTP